MRMLAYGVAADAVDEYMRIGESTAIESLKKFVRAMIEIFSDEYLRSPNSNDIARLLMEGSHNDINVLNRSSFFKDLSEGRAPLDVERAFRVLQARFAIVRGPARFWGCDTLNDIMKVCVIMHNMIAENERGTDIEYLNDDESEENPQVIPSCE
ncbi:hypothetical protein Dsin_012137 [Dipteronia sinensis]|uniref:DDE Tnp4 domain-containing protein n=1 Tax=Dipteronia sinensis TaxID=43782 RepID=A0AAE0E869_9ROSI|nr:hypothetical protein Dsin_012137 [Dipteronia sinensis]